MSGAPGLPLVLVHGWGFDASVWQALRTELGGWPVQATEAGYFGQPVAGFDPPSAYVAVGHSLGAMRCLESAGPGCRGLVLINGFSRFSAAADFPEGVPTRLLDRMLSRLGGDAAAVVRDFRTRCGAAQIPAGAPAKAPLEADLLRLRDGDARKVLAQSPIPMRILAAGNDAIVPPALTRAAFAGRENATHWLEDGGHLLPVTHAAWCARQLRAFLSTLPDGSRGE